MKIEFDKFQDLILQYFDKAKKNDDKETTKELIMQILRDFHLYWNMLRQQKNIQQVKLDTKRIIKQLLIDINKEEIQTQMKVNTLVGQIMRAYFKFIKAYKTKIELETNSTNLLMIKIRDVYKNAVSLIQKDIFSGTTLVKVVKKILILSELLFDSSLTEAEYDERAIQQFVIGVLVQIQKEYSTIAQQLKKVGLDNKVKQVKQFTAIVLLKLKHQAYSIFHVKGSNSLHNQNYSNDQSNVLATKIYYKVRDAFMLIPSYCQSRSQNIDCDRINQRNTQNCRLKPMIISCFYEYAKKFQTAISKEFKLKRSTSGIQILSNIRAAVSKIANSFEKSDKFWADFNNFKANYYKELFIAFQDLKKVYNINTIERLEDLQSKILETIFQYQFEDKSNDDIQISKLIQFMQSDIYEVFLNLKTVFNNQPNIEQ